MTSQRILHCPTSQVLASAMLELPTVTNKKYEF
jgi:hypothetical protein